MMPTRQRRNPNPSPRRSDQSSRGSPWRHHQQAYFHLAHQAWGEQANVQPFYIHGEELHYQAAADRSYAGGAQYFGQSHGQGEEGGIYDHSLNYVYGDRRNFNPPNQPAPDEYIANGPDQPDEDREYSQPPPDALSPGATMAYVPTSVVGRVPLVRAERYGALDTETELYERYVWECLQDVYYGPALTNYGTLSLVLRHSMRVDITVDYAIRVVNLARHCSAAISSWGESSSVCHEHGCAFQERMNADVATGPLRAKISSRGVAFTARNYHHAYLVDASGIESTAERFENLNYDHSMRAFRSNSDRGMDIFERCVALMNHSRSHTTVNGDIWMVGGVRIRQTSRGDVQVSRSSGELVLRCSTGGNIFVATPYIKMGASWDPNNYFYAFMGQKSVRGSAGAFSVKNGTQEAGFDRRGRLTPP